ncbi:MAG: AbrB family transcriptional regulator, partial [Pseudomonadota bacterium]
RFARPAVTLALAGGGAVLAHLAGLPAAALIGATAVVGALAVAGAPMMVPNALRDGAFTAIGCSMGAGVTPDIVSEMLRWPLSLAILLLALAAMIAVSTTMLSRLFGFDRTTALLASSPGALSYTLALVSEGRGDPRAVMVLQSIRLFAITLGLPLILGFAAGPVGADTATIEDMGWLAAGVVFACAYAAGSLAAAQGLPAAFLVAGLALSTALHAGGVLEGLPPDAFVAVGLCVTGAVIGARFAGATLGELGRLGLAASAVVLASTGIAALAALGASRVLAIPFGQAWVTYAPGGVEAMAAMALALDYDPAFVAVHHVLRIMALIVVLPILLGRHRYGPD